jgi:hypothetical protein
VHLEGPRVSILQPKITACEEIPQLHRSKTKEEDLKLDSTYTVDIAFHCGKAEHVIGGGIVPKVLLLLIVSKAT